MSISRIYQPLLLKPGLLLQLDEKASHHLARVLRAKIGDFLVIFNGQGGEHQAVIKQINKKNIEVEILGFVPKETESLLSLQLAQGMARGEKMDFIVQKAVELGVKRIIPLVTERCNVRLSEERGEKRLQHWQSVVISACEQSGRNELPEIVSPLPLLDWLPQVLTDYRFVLSPHTHQTLSVSAIPPAASITLLVGPEGGLTEQEVQLAVDHGFLPLQLGPRTLRTETAALAALAVFQACFGDLTTRLI